MGDGSNFWRSPENRVARQRAHTREQTKATHTLPEEEHRHKIEWENIF